jgi:pyruvate dehydrogenase E2 component (dihydrolipoamide acetyltransferase)
MPKLSPTMDEGAIAKWHKKEGDHVEAGDVIMEVSTDKATVEHAALDPGWLRKILVKEGENAIVNQPIAIFTENKDESIEGYKPEGAQVKEAKTAEIRKEVSSREYVQEAPQTQAVPGPTYRPEPPLENYEFNFPTGFQETRIKASPLARKLAKEQNLDLTAVKGSGPNERIMSRDLELAQKKGSVSFSNRELPQAAPGSFEEEPLTPMRKSVGQRMQESKMFIPHFYVTLEVDADPIAQIREQLEKGGIKVSINDLLIRATALALREHPNVNSGYHPVNNTILRFKTVDISVAVSVPGGLITPIIRNADFKNVGQISVEMKELVSRAKEGKLKTEEYRGGSFSISNMGMYGVTNFQAVINPPQAAILAVSAIREVPIVKNGQVISGKTMNLTLSLDHRVLDGAIGSQFLRTLQKYVVNPYLLMI